LKSLILGEPVWRKALSGSDFGEFDHKRISKFGPNNCLSNNFLHYEFQLLTDQFKIFNLGTILERAFSGSHFGEFASKKTPKFGPNNCLTNVFLHYEFHFVC